MHKNFSESTQKILTDEKIEMPQIKNNHFNKSSVNKNTNYFKKTIRHLVLRNK